MEESDNSCLNKSFNEDDSEFNKNIENIAINTGEKEIVDEENKQKNIESKSKEDAIQNNINKKEEILFEDVNKEFHKQDLEEINDINKKDFDSDIKLEIMEDFKSMNIKDIGDFNSEMEFDSEILARSNIDFHTNKQKFNKNKKTFFNILIIGPKNSGKTTFIENISKKIDKRSYQYVIKSTNTETEPEIISKKKIRKTSLDYRQTCDFCTYEFIKCHNEDSNKQNSDTFRFIDSPGYFLEEGYFNYSQKIINLIKNRLDKHYEYSNSVIKNFDEKNDDRIHLVLYFLLNLENEDLKLIKEITSYTNVIPIIAKGDIYKNDFIESFKERINRKAREYEIDFYNVYNSLYNLTTDINLINTILSGKTKFCPPFMISDILLSKFHEEYSQDKITINSIDMFDINSKKYRDYFYKRELCDFFKLRDILFNFIPFDCLENAKKLYRYYKNQIIASKNEDKDFKENERGFFNRLFNITIAVASITPVILKIVDELKK